MKDLSKLREEIEVTKDQLHQDLKDLEDLMNKEYEKIMKMTDHYEKDI